MPGWIIAAAIGTVVLTALLTFALWRMNKPMLDRHKNGDGGAGGEGGYAPTHDRHDTSDSSDGGSDGGGGDGGGD